MQSFINQSCCVSESASIAMWTKKMNKNHLFYNVYETQIVKKIQIFRAYGSMRGSV